MLAIIIPYYKLTFFEATLASLANQTDKRFKVYIGDDTSPEDCTILLEKYRGQFDFVYHRFENNLGSTSLVKQWERCIALSGDEEWLMILGDDDVLDDNVIEEFYNNFIFFNTISNVIRFSTKLIFENSGLITKSCINPVLESPTDAFYRKFIGQTNSSLSEYVFSKKSFQKYRFYDYPLAWNSDDRAWLDFSDDLPIYAINTSTVSIRISDFNISGQKDNMLLKNHSKIKFYAYLLKNKQKFYDGKQRIKILRRYMQEIRKYRKISFFERIELVWFCFKNFEIEFWKTLIIHFLSKLKTNGKK